MTDVKSVLRGVAQAQFRSFAANMPPFYGSVAATMLTAMVVFHRDGPLWFVVGMPCAFIAICIWRIRWWTAHRSDRMTDKQAQQHLSRATLVLVGSTVLLMTMDVAIFSRVGMHAKYYVIVQILASTMAGFYCLMHLRSAASLIAVALMVPFTGFLFSMKDVAAAASAINSLINVGLMMSVMLRYQREFTSLVHSEAETARLSKENVRLANLDMLTGLPNRRLFFETLAASLHDAAESGSKIAVGIADLDGFKPVNDTHGHRVGDAVLAEVARRLETVADSVFVARVGGDEFGFVMSNFENDGTLAGFGDRVIGTISAQVEVGSIVTSVGCSIGFAIFPDAATTLDILYERADYALYHAKRSGRSRSVVFAEHHEAILKQHGQIEQALRNADLEQEMFPLFQPIVDIQANRTVAFESLARWESPALGTVSPAIFIPIAEQAGLIGDLTLVLLRKSLRAAAAWPNEINLSFNVSPFDISSQSQTARLIEIIRDSRINPSRISIELTETALLHNFIDTNANMYRLQQTGVTISLDDFGTGYSSLSHIHALPFNTLKIDKSFVDEIRSNARSRNIVRSLITLCNDMGIGCVVEGIETAEQLDVVHQLGAVNIQGYFFSRPIDAATTAAFLRSREPVALPQEKELPVPPAKVVISQPDCAS